MESMSLEVECMLPIPGHKFFNVPCLSNQSVDEAHVYSEMETKAKQIFIIQVKNERAGINSYLYLLRQLPF